MLRQALPLLFAAAFFPSCYEQSDRDTEGLEVDCLDIQCPWTVEEGTPVFGPTWHDGDVGLDLSNPGPISVSLKVVLIGKNSRQFDLSASVFRDPEATLHVDFDWYGVGQGTGPTFWDRSPPLLAQERVDATESGAYVFHRHVTVPSEAAAFVLHVVKEGGGRAYVDQLTVDHFDHVSSN
jgi:hypothetical protein